MSCLIFPRLTVGKVLRLLTHRCHLTNFQEFSGLEIFTACHFDHCVPICQKKIWVFYAFHLFLSNFLFPIHIFAAPQQIGLSKWKNYGKYVHKNARILIHCIK